MSQIPTAGAPTPVDPTTAAVQAVQAIPSAPQPTGAPTPNSAPAAQTTIPGTEMPTPVGTGVEKLVAVTPPFRNNAPPWYTPGVWGQLGCAVPQPGRYLHTLNEPIFQFVDVTQRQLFHALWHYDDRLFTRFPSRDFLWDIYQLLKVGRKRLADNTVLDNQSPLQPSHAEPVPMMFNVYPVPLYGRMGCVNSWINQMATMTLLMCTEAMQHTDNTLAYYYTKNFFDTVYGYVKYLLVSMATKFFGVDKAVASADTFEISDDLWKAYNPAQFSVSVEATSVRPPIGWKPTDLDLEPINGIPIQQTIPLLQPWPDTVLKYSMGGIWQPTATGAQTASGQNVAAQANPSLFTKQGPPSG